MRNRWQSKETNKKGLAARLDRATRDVNAFLLAMAIGLAALDFTCYFAFKVSEAMPADGFPAAEASIAAAPATAGAVPPASGADHAPAPRQAIPVFPARHD
jgi:hypothetical protein